LPQPVAVTAHVFAPAPVAFGSDGLRDDVVERRSWLTSGNVPV
jgi:hypothetical protein